MKMLAHLIIVTLRIKANNLVKLTPKSGATYQGRYAYIKVENNQGV